MKKIMLSVLGVSFFTMNVHADALDCTDRATAAALAVNNLTMPGSSVHQVQQVKNTPVGNLQYLVLIKEGSSLIPYTIETSNGFETAACRIMKLSIPPL